MIKLGVYTTDKNATLPTQATESSSCYDVYSNLTVGQEINIYTKGGLTPRKVQQNNETKEPYLVVYPFDRVQVPTGLILDIPEGHDVKLYPRSGLSLKNGINLANCTAVIDEDYVNELFIIIQNTSQDSFILTDKMRIAQLELCKKNEWEISKVTKKPTQKTNRKGGLGSTGTKADDKETKKEESK